MLNIHRNVAVLFAGLALATLASIPSTAQAGSDTPEFKATVQPPPEVTTSNVTGDGGASFVTSYYSRGILQGPQGATGFDVQPYFDLYFKLYEDDKAAFVNKIQIQLSLWANLASDTRPAFGGRVNAGVGNWTEFDWMPGMTFTLAKNFTLSTSYFEFDYPAQGGSPQRSFDTTLSYNDADLLGMWALNPHVTFLQELTGNPNGGHVGLGLAGGSKLGQYYEVGIAPSFTFMKSSQYPLTLTIPITTGFGSNGFYGTGFGYAAGSLNLSVPLAFIPSSFGSWTANAGFTEYYLAHNLAVQNAALNYTGANSGGGHDHDAQVGTIGFGLTF